MWFNFLFARPSSGRAQARRNPTSPRVTVEALDDRILLSAAAKAPPPADAALVGALSGDVAVAQQQTLDVDGTFNVTGVHGSRLSATVDGNLPWVSGLRKEKCGSRGRADRVPGLCRGR